MKVPSISMVVISVAAVVLAGCGGAAKPAAQPVQQSPAGPVQSGQAASAQPEKKHYSGQKITFAIQFGLSYAPAVAMVQKGFLEEQLPGIQVDYKQLAAGAPIREAMIAGQVDVGFMGLGPAIQGWDKGVDWKIAGAMGSMPLFLNGSTGAKSVKDIKPDEKIALPGPGSIQDVVLAMEAERQGLNPKQFQPNLVAMSHPDGEKALYARGEVKYHLSSPPFQYRQLKSPGITKVFDSYEAVGGPHTFNVMVITRKFKEARPDVYDGLVKALEKAVNWVKDNPEAAADLMIATGDKTPKEELVAMIKDPQIEWTITPKGLERFATFMQKTGFTKRSLKDWRDLSWENLHNLPGN